MREFYQKIFELVESFFFKAYQFREAQLNLLYSCYLESKVQLKNLNKEEKALWLIFHLLFLNIIMDIFIFLIENY